MGATSVTGVGHGSVEGMDAGRKEYSVSGNRLLGPRVVVADTVVLSGSSMTVVLPYLAGGAANYSAFISDNTAAAATGIAMSFPTDSAGNLSTTLTLYGTSGHTVSYAIVKQGLLP